MLHDNYIVHRHTVVISNVIVLEQVPVDVMLGAHYRSGLKMTPFGLLSNSTSDFTTVCRWIIYTYLTKTAIYFPNYFGKIQGYVYRRIFRRQFVGVKLYILLLQPPKNLELQRNYSKHEH